MSTNKIVDFSHSLQFIYNPFSPFTRNFLWHAHACYPSKYINSQCNQPNVDVLCTSDSLEPYRWHSNVFLSMLYIECHQHTNPINVIENPLGQNSIAYEWQLNFWEWAPLHSDLVAVWIEADRWAPLDESTEDTRMSRVAHRICREATSDPDVKYVCLLGGWK